MSTKKQIVSSPETTQQMMVDEIVLKQKQMGLLNSQSSSTKIEKSSKIEKTEKPPKASKPKKETSDKKTSKKSSKEQKKVNAQLSNIVAEMKDSTPKNSSLRPKTLLSPKKDDVPPLKLEERSPTTSPITTPLKLIPLKEEPKSELDSQSCPTHTEHSQHQTWVAPTHQQHSSPQSLPVSIVNSPVTTPINQSPTRAGIQCDNTKFSTKKTKRVCQSQLYMESPRFDSNTSLIAKIAQLEDICKKLKEVAKKQQEIIDNISSELRH
ncbi:hypothetical protein EIN_096940 [Entamoeba invadens IP1]|uniref:Uncharacterized protein n=1 Tax=Entamoeba invadens IP1 TaxID=370355 RepID=A0A0A1U0N0_ENTIV|nr:hypothetical protein EIN_096940 [Entamoeba invadens IP1]ELP87427.1 hypothetical protein EIN_096940 [Entamoeba invadens IP1]|eukprot:XP_004254198.1 hypothetical protein EIN_096940 [Entamoeba invadens IP1]